LTAEPDPAAPSRDIEAATLRLERALSALEAKLRRGPPRNELFEADRAKLAAQLDAARAREKALEAVAAEASAALGQAAAEVRAAMRAGVEAR
jgi:hypothetical protein